jgi:hypothetical protein
MRSQNPGNSLPSGSELDATLVSLSLQSQAVHQKDSTAQPRISSTSSACFFAPATSSSASASTMNAVMPQPDELAEKIMALDSLSRQLGGIQKLLYPRHEDLKYPRATSAYKDLRSIDNLGIQRELSALKVKFPKSLPAELVDDAFAFCQEILGGIVLSDFVKKDVQLTNLIYKTSALSQELRDCFMQRNKIDKLAFEQQTVSGKDEAKKAEYIDESEDDMDDEDIFTAREVGLDNAPEENEDADLQYAIALSMGAEPATSSSASESARPFSRR